MSINKKRKISILFCFSLLLVPCFLTLNFFFSSLPLYICLLFAMIFSLSMCVSEIIKNKQNMFLELMLGFILCLTIGLYIFFAVWFFPFK
jgi:hypothetical protein